MPAIPTEARTRQKAWAPAQNITKEKKVGGKQKVGVYLPSKHEALRYIFEGSSLSKIKTQIKPGAGGSCL
jgi:hypothetical protein